MMGLGACSALFYRGTSPGPSRFRAALRFFCGWMMGDLYDTNVGTIKYK